MRALGCRSLLLGCLLTGSAFGQAPPDPPPPPPEPAPEPATVVIEPAPPVEAPPAPPAAPAAPPPSAPNVGPLDDKRPANATVIGTRVAPAQATTRRPYERDFAALPLLLEARVGFNTRLASAFADSADEELLDTNAALGAYLAWRPEFALGLELEHTGLGRLKAISDQNSINATYSGTGAWLGARVFPLRRERLDVFVNLRVGLVMQHIDVKGTRASSPLVTASPFSCREWDGPGLGIGGAAGVAYRLSHHVSVSTRLDLTGLRLSGDALGSCADGIGSTSSIGGTIGLAYEFETAPR